MTGLFMLHAVSIRFRIPWNSAIKFNKQWYRHKYSLHFSFWVVVFFHQFSVDQGNGGGIMTESSVCMTPLPTVRSVFTTLYFLPITNEPWTNLNSFGVRQKWEEYRYIYQIDCSDNDSAPLGDLNFFFVCTFMIYDFILLDVQGSLSGIKIINYSNGELPSKHNLLTI